MRPRRPSVTSLAGASCALWLGSLGCEPADYVVDHLGNTAVDGSPTAPADAAPRVTDLSGRWIGEAEDPLRIGPNGAPGVYRFPSGVSDIRLELIPGERGTLTFGTPVPPPPPSNFDVGYPEGVNYLRAATLEATTLPPVEGFAYQLEAWQGLGIGSIADLGDQAVADGVFRFYYRQNQVFADWCTAQQPFEVYPDTYSCVGTTSYGGSDEACEMVPLGASEAEVVPVDCGKLYMCAAARVPICECSKNGCYPNSADSVPGVFLRRVGDELVGAFVQSVFFDAAGALTSVGSVRFHRVD